MLCFVGSLLFLAGMAVLWLPWPRSAKVAEPAPPAAAESAATATPFPAAFEAAGSRSSAWSLRCAAAGSGSPIAGVCAYGGAQGDLLVAGPSDDSGRLDFPGPPPGAVLVLWAPSWLPAEIGLVGSEPWPEQVILTPASGTLFVHLQNLEAGWQIYRTLLRDRSDPAPPAAPWAPALEEVEPGLWRGRGLAPGRYEVALWIRADPRLSWQIRRVDVAVSDGEASHLYLDARRPPEPDVD